ncbi:MCE family protein [Thiohalocapsa marina]|uniref:MCE family protein n=1 Tax=Thiohalocapsa marina TaxID=424902 RepID=A0A5M8FHD4_9GAMM|nr:MlaD family protein [Thiohalocapsa marina]KAA6183834.1 MCE family protein [Thiohalocapsa marina]
MSKQANPTVIGGFVLGALGLVVLAIIVFSSGALLRERVPMVTYFPGSVQGLSVGAQVQFQGVPIGQVTQIGVDYLTDRESFRIPVRYEIWPQNVRVISGPDDAEADVRQVLQRLVNEKGLRARLESVSFVTGQYLVSLSLNPDLPARSHAHTPDGPIRVPALPATRDRMEELLTNLDLDSLVNTANDTLAALRDLAQSRALTSAVEGLSATLNESSELLAKLNASFAPLLERADMALGNYAELAARLSREVEPLSSQLQQTAQDLSDLTRRLDARVGPVADAATDALRETGNAMRALEGLAGEGSSTRAALDGLLGEATRAARALYQLADYLERHPEAMVQGKR